MVVIGGLGSIPGAVLGALYLVGLPAVFGTTSTTQFLTSGLGLIAFILYLPGGLAEVLHRVGDLATDGHRAPAGRVGGRRPRRPSPTGPLRSRGARRGGRLVTRAARHADRAPPASTSRTWSCASEGCAPSTTCRRPESGSIVGLIGPNGSGKTTVLDAI